MDIINRSAIILRPKQPYLDWTKLDDATGIAESVFKSMRERPTVYLVPDWEAPEERQEILKEFWPALFEAMLEGWLRDESMWPKERTFQMFQEWIEVETHAMLVDIYEDEAIDYIA